jgi:7-carboxy-7-deazaguanine synthase
LVEITGGEPLLQAGVLPLMTRLCDIGCTVLIETSGALDIRPVDRRVHRIVDWKCPSSGETDRNFPENLTALRPTDELKFVVGTEADYAWMKGILERNALAERCPVLVSWVAPLLPGQRAPTLKPVPADDRALSCRELAERVVADALPVRFQLQMHKVIWSPETRGV